MKYTRARVIDNGEEQTISIFTINDDNREYYKDKLYCPEPGCTAKLHEYKRNGRIYYQANPNSHIEGCNYENQASEGIPIGNGEIEIPLTERHFQQSIRDSYEKSINPRDNINGGSQGNEGGNKTSSSTVTTSDEGGRSRGRGVIGGEKVPGVKEPPILNREIFTDSDIGYPRKLVGIKINSIDMIDGTLKIGFEGENYKNVFAIIGDAYKAENGVSDLQIGMVKKYIDYHLLNHKDIKFWGGGLINKYNDTDYIIELFFQESFIINGYEILGICHWVKNYLE